MLEYRMKKNGTVIFIVGITLKFFLLSSCSSENNTTLKIQHLENENLQLKEQLKAIKLKLKNEVISPIIIENNYGGIMKEKASFAAFLAYDRPKLIDSIEFNLYELNSANMESSKVRTIKKKYTFKQGYVDIINVDFENLHTGTYQVKGCFYVCDEIGNTRVLEFKRDFTIRE